MAVRPQNGTKPMFGLFLFVLVLLSLFLSETLPAKPLPQSTLEINQVWFVGIIGGEDDVYG